MSRRESGQVRVLASHELTLSLCHSRLSRKLGTSRSPCATAALGCAPILPLHSSPRLYMFTVSRMRVKGSWISSSPEFMEAPK